MTCHRRISYLAWLIGFVIVALGSYLYYILPVSTPRAENFRSVRILPPFSSHAQTDTVYPTDTGAWPYRTYKSSSLRPPVLEITTNGGAIAEGSLFLVPGHQKHAWIAQELPIIMSQDNDLIFGFERPSGFNDRFNGFHPQNVNGISYATIWLGSSKIGHGYGNVIILDDQYQYSTITLDAAVILIMNGNHIGVIDFHEHQLTDRGTILVTAYNSTTQDLTALAGREDGWVTDSLFFEIDIETNEHVFSWSALDHFHYTQSKLPLPCYMSDGSKQLGYDFFHINSIQAMGENFLISSRH